MLRRRGAALENAILEATWAELAAVGYARLTMEAVAARAGTSKPVLYRRWPGRAQLVVAALRAHAPMLSAPVPDTGSLRGDVLALLGRVSDHLATIGQDTLWGIAADHFASVDNVLGEHALHVGADAMAALLDRAVARGEIPTAALPRRVLTLPVDLARHDMLLARAPVPAATLEEIVDDLFLPLVHAASVHAASVHAAPARARTT